MPSWKALLGSDVIQLPPGLMREAWLPSRDAQHLAGDAEAGGWPVPDPASKNGSCTGPAARSRAAAAGRPSWDTEGPVSGGEVSPGGTSGAPHRALGHGDSTLTPHTQAASTQAAVTAPRTRGALVSSCGERSVA